jgi:cation:H+ antiporter
MMVFGGLALGVALLLVGGTLLVRGASAIATGAGISPMVVGLTVVAFGTSSPELVVNVLAAIQGQSALAFGNVVGSNIANLGLVLGAAGLIAPIAMQGQLVVRELPLLLLATSVLVVLALDVPLRGEAAYIDRADALVLLLLFGIFIYVSALDIVRQRKDVLLQGIAHLPVPSHQIIKARDLMYTLAGVLGLAVGGHLTISYGAELAEVLGVGKTVIGVAIIAVGTSLPELVTSVIAAIRREPDLSVGNVVGSNLFNGLFVLPAGALVAPVAVPVGGAIDLSISLLFALALFPVFLIGNSLLGRTASSLFLGGYLLYIGYRITTAF